MSRKTEHQNKENNVRNFSSFRDVPLGWMKYLAPKKAFALVETPPPFCIFPGKKNEARLPSVFEHICLVLSCFLAFSAVAAAQGIMGRAKDTLSLCVFK